MKRYVIRVGNEYQGHSADGFNRTTDLQAAYIYDEAKANAIHTAIPGSEKLAVTVSLADAEKPKKAPAKK